MKKEKVITVIMPVYNAEKTLSRAVDSILAQTYPHFQLLLIDDGSTDESATICDRYTTKDRRIEVIHQKNQGVSHARNVGLSHASGEYICFVDSDDYIAPSHLENYAQHISNCDLLLQGLTLVEWNNTTEIRCTDKFLFAKTPTEIDNLLIKAFPFIGYVATKCLCRKIIVEYDLFFNEELSFREDELFMLSYLEHVSSVGLLPTTSYYYQKTEEGLSSKYYKTSKLLETLDLLQTAVNRLSKYPKFYIQTSSVLSDGYVRGINNLYNHNAICHSWRYRIHCLNILKERNHSHPSMEIQNYMKGNIYVMDFLRYMRALYRRKITR